MNWQKRKIKIGVLFLCLLTLSSCSLFSKKEQTKMEKPVLNIQLHDDQKERNQLFKQAIALYEKSEFAEALLAFQNFKQKYAADKRTLVACFYAAESSAKLKKWPQAIKYHREVIAHVSSGNTLKAKSLYRLSYAYEAVGENIKVISSLLDSLRLKRYLESRIALAEAPARLAAAYARMGNAKMADIKYQEAEQGLLGLQRAFRSSQLGKERGKKQASGWYPNWYIRTLYNMGSVFTEFSTSKELAGEMDFLLRPLKKGQLYLLKAVEGANEEENRLEGKRSADRIQQVYLKLWKFIDSFKSEEGLSKSVNDISDLQLNRKRTEEKKWQMTHFVLDLVEDLKNNRVKSPYSNKPNIYEEEVFTFLSKYEKKLTNFLESGSVDRELTPEAQEREGIKRKGSIR